MMRRLAIVLLGVTPLAGCAAAGSAVTTLATAGVAGAVGSASGSALLGAVVGFGVSYGVDQGVKYVERRIEGNVQIAIAETAGPLADGQSAPWNAPETLPLSGKSGTVEVARSFGEAIPCKDIVFTDADDRDHHVFTTTICRNDQGVWVWALGEPSIHRWGYLQ
jgi:hypothetical protein